MCSLSDNSSDINALNARLEDTEISEIDVVKKCKRTSDKIIFKDNEIGEPSGIDKELCKAFTNKTPIIAPHRRDMMKDTSTFLKDILGGSKIADVISIEGGGTVHIGHVINITEQIVLNTDNNELEPNTLNTHKVRDYTNHFNMVDRMHWLAQPEVGEIDPIKSPAKYVIICHTATQEAFTQAENILMLRLMQTFHIESRGWADIAYNFCIGSDGNVYEGRGWYKEGSHTVTYNKYSVGIAFMGCFLNNLPPKTALKRCQDLVAHGVQIGAISPDYELIAHCQCRPFLSPGQCLFGEIKTWQNFNPNIVNANLCIFQS